MNTMEDVPLLAVREALHENKVNHKSKKKLFDDYASGLDHLRNAIPTITCNQGTTNANDDENEHIQRSDWVFIEEVPEYMKCNIICCNIFVAPQLLTCCGKNICKGCIESHFQRATVFEANQKPSCPHCRKKEYRVIENTALELSISHLKVECLYRNNGCGWTGTLKSGKLHLKECDFILIDCPNGCGCEKFERSKLHNHIAVCPLQYINCPFQAVGCITETLFLRTEMNEMHAINDLHEHLLLIAQFNVQVSSECEYNSTLITSVQENSIKENDGAIRSQIEVLELLKSATKLLGDSLQVTKRTIDLLKHESAAGKICLTELKNKNGEAENTRACFAATIEAVRALPVPKAIGISCSPVTFTVDNFKKRMVTNDAWLSPPFYTHIGGYKMCLSVYPNGYGNVSGKYVSAGIHFVMGEYDDYLKWPFPGAIITLTALTNRHALRNRSIHFELTGEETGHIRSKQIDGSLSHGLKMPKFLDRQRALSNFLTGNSFQVMVYRIQFLPL